MANPNTPFGLKPCGFIYPPNKYEVSATHGTALGIGDPVVGAAAGTVESIAAYATANPILGAVAGFENASGIKVAYFPASSTGTWHVWVYDNPNQEFMVQDDGDTTPVAAADRFNSANLVYTAAPNSSTGISGVELNGSDAAGAFAAADQVRILGLVDMPDNAIGQYSKWRVRIQNHMLTAGIVGVGV